MKRLASAPADLTSTIFIDCITRIVYALRFRWVVRVVAEYRKNSRLEKSLALNHITGHSQMDPRGFEALLDRIGIIF